MGIAALLNLSHGGWEAMTTGAFTEHDLPLAEGLLDHIVEGDLLLADRAFCSYAYIAAVLARGGHVAMRLHQQRDAALDWRKGRKISRYERLVTWRRPALSAFKGKLTHEAWEALPATLEVRLIRLDYEDRTGRCRPLTVVTTSPTRRDDWTRASLASMPGAGRSNCGCATSRRRSALR